ncbi:MAG: hypothetical protein DRH24_10895 [Deltaproteobacteria bacterium]|nr:MAG: hypothetical protein DRH24_10895 [Deltaproteobacteria bacterium]
MNMQRKPGQGSEKRIGLGPALVTLVWLTTMAVFWIRPYGYNPSALIRFGSQNSYYKPGLIPSRAVILENKGYDGQYYYYASRDLLAQKKNIPAFRQQRIGLPLIAWLLGLGKPWPTIIAMIIINLVVASLSTFVAACILHGRGISNWWALLIGINTGTILNVYFSLTSSLMVFFLVAGWWAYERDMSCRTLICWSLAILTRETAVGVVGPVVLWELTRGRWKKAGVIALTAVPFGIWQIYLWQQLNDLAMIKSGGLLTLPGVGLFQYLKSLPTGPLSKSILLAWSNIAIAVLALWSMATGIVKAMRIWSLEPLILTLWGILLLCAKFNPLWVESITGLGRIAAPIYLFMVLSCHDRVDLNSKLLIVVSITLGMTLSFALMGFPVPGFFYV